MAEIALTAVVEKAIAVVSNLAVEEGSRLYWLPEKIRWIQKEMTHIHCYLEDADAKQVGDRRVANLIDDIRDLAYDVEDILDVFLPKMASYNKKGLLGCVTSVGGIFRYWYTRHNFAMEIEKIRIRVEDIDRKRTTYGINDTGGRGGTRDPRPAVRRDDKDEPNVIGLDRGIQELKARVLEEEKKYDVISIVGMPGIGKTTLAKKVFNSTQSHFQCSAFVSVSLQPQINKIAQDIAKQVLLHEDKNGNLEDQLLEFLRGKRYVILLDDIWTTETWDDLKIMMPLNSENGSRLIITSRNSGVGRYIGGESSLHELTPMNENDSWKLFSNMVMTPIIVNSPNEPCVPPELEDTGMRIVERCGGLPLAIVLAAGLLLSREKTEHAWEGVLERMGHDQEDKCSKILALSYRDLRPDLRPCFLYLGLFPEDHEISAFELISMWVAEKFIKGPIGNRRLEDVGADNLDELASRNLIQVVRRRFDGRIISCRIHDLLHSLCISLAGESNFFLTSARNFSTCLRRVAHHGDGGDELLSYDWTPKLRVFLSFGSSNFKLRHNSSKDFRFVRVLILCSFNTTKVDFANNIENMIHLTYLRLDYGGRFPATISKLKSLLTLDVRGSMHLELPTTLLKMKQLRHLFLPVLVDFYIPGSCQDIRRNRSLVEANLPNLETLFCETPPYGYRQPFRPLFWPKSTSLRTLSGCCCEEIIEQLSDANPISHSLENLRLFRRGLKKSVPINLSRYEGLKRVHLTGSVSLGADLHAFPPNLVKLTLAEFDLEDSHLETFTNLPKLKILKLSPRSTSHQEKKVWELRGQQCFPQLEVLKLIRIRELEKLTAEEGALPKLKTLSIDWCPDLRYVSDNLVNLMTETSLAGGGTRRIY